MTTLDQIAAQLAQLDAAIAAAPDDADALEARARFRARTTWPWQPVLADCAAALRARVARGEFAVADHAVLAGDWFERGARARSFDERKFARAMALAHCESALRFAPTDGDLWRLRARICIVLGERPRAEADFERARELDGDNAQSYLEQAYYFEQSEEFDAARDAFDIGLMMKLDDGSWPGNAQWCLARASNEKLPGYQRHAWLDWGVENAPNDIPLRLARSRLLRGRNIAAALADLDFALQIAPRDPALYRARAELYLNWWSLDEKERFRRASADYAAQLRLQIAAGLEPSDAQMLADIEAIEGRDTGEKIEMVRRHARFSVALELAPHDAPIHVKRGISAWPQLGYEMPTIDDVELAPLFDFLRAFGVAPSLQSARQLAASLLKRYCWRESAHQQIEALLEARELLREFGLSAPLVAEVMSAVEAKLNEAE